MTAFLSQKETPPISLVSERLLIAYAEAVIEANQRGGDGSSENAELNLRRRISMLENYVYVPAPAVPPPEIATTGPGAWLQRLCVRFDRLFSFDHSDARQAKADYDEAFHDAVHALKDLRQFASIIAPTWSATSRVSQSAPPPEIVEALDNVGFLITMLKEKAINFFIARDRRGTSEKEEAEYDAARSRVEQLFREQREEIERLRRQAKDSHSVMGQIIDARDSISAELASLKKEQLTPGELFHIYEVMLTESCNCETCRLIREKLRSISGHTSTRGEE